LPLALACITVAARAEQAGVDEWSGWTLWYEQPAARWEEALPVGNGRLGAMVFGNAGEERLQLNEDTLWAGQPLARERVGAREHLETARDLFFAGRYVEGQRLMQEQFMSPRLIRSYQTLGDLHVTVDGAGEIDDYRRALDLDTAVTSVRYRAGEATFTRECFASPVDQVIVLRLECDRPGRIAATIALPAAPRRATSTPGCGSRGSASSGSKAAG
jgi:alpha-L-fucosidase 2